MRRIKYEIDIMSNGEIKYFKILDFVFLFVPIRVKDPEKIKEIRRILYCNIP